MQTLARQSKLWAGRGLLQSAVIFCAMAMASGPAMSAGGNVDAETHKVLKAMSAYLSSLQKVSVQADVDIEVVMMDGQKLQLTSLVDIALERPDRLRVQRQGAYADVQINDLHQHAATRMHDGDRRRGEPAPLWHDLLPVLGRPIRRGVRRLRPGEGTDLRGSLFQRCLSQSEMRTACDRIRKTGEMPSLAAV